MSVFAIRYIMGRNRHLITISDIRRLERMAAIGTVSAEEADAAIGRYEGFARYWAKQRGLKFANGRVSLMYRLIFHRKS